LECTTKVVLYDTENLGLFLNNGKKIEKIPQVISEISTGTMTVKTASKM
jgi:hypothetical protein